MKRYIVTFLLFVSAVVTTQAMSYLQALPPVAPKTIVPHVDERKVV